MVKKIEDLSYSNLVSLIQGEEIKGADILNSIACELEENKQLIERLENELSSSKIRNLSLLEASKRVLQHLKKEYPLTVKRNGYVIVVTKENVLIERNVL